MGYKHNLYICAILICLAFTAVWAQKSQKGKFTKTRFSCIGKASGYYADVETGCQVYHMCDGLGRQFSYKCPNMTLFQQRMLICDHWYMVNCSMSERDFDANLLIGQRDKPFVSDDDMRLRTPRPDILSAPPYNPYLDVLREDEKLFDLDNNDLDTKQSQNPFKSPINWSPGASNRRQDTIIESEITSNKHNEITLKEHDITAKPNRRPLIRNKSVPKIIPPPTELVPPFIPTTQATEHEDSHTEQSANPVDPVFKFIKRFDPTEPDIHQTAMSKSEILDLNAHLPDGQASSEEDRNPKKNRDSANNFNTFKTHNDKTFTEDTRFDSVNTKSKPTETVTEDAKEDVVSEPDRVLLPPKTDYSDIVSTTVGPPIYYEWRWAVPAFDLVPPKEDNETKSANTLQTRSLDKFEGKNPFSAVTRPDPITTSPEPFVVEYNISSYLVPDYVFPLDKEHPGYEKEDAQTSFQVEVARPGRASYGENPKCPQCHPAYLEPGSCEPCIVKR